MLPPLFIKRGRPPGIQHMEHAIRCMSWLGKAAGYRVGRGGAWRDSVTSVSGGDKASGLQWNHVRRVAVQPYPKSETCTFVRVFTWEVTLLTNISVPHLVY